MARFDKPWTQNLRGATLTVESPTPETLFRAIASQLVELRRSSSATSRAGRQRLISLLEQIPCLDNLDSGETELACWWISFDLEMFSPIAWRVVRKLGVLLNTPCSSKRMSVTFRPVPQEGSETLRWEIASTAPELDPADVARWLRDNLPQPMDEEAAWTAMDEE
jgi:hypothetical protein